jgi:hypothetical protein
LSAPPSQTKISYAASPPRPIKMKLNLKDEPKEWRKSALLAALGLALISSALRWRHVLVTKSWLSVLGVLAVVAVAALIRPRLFRGYHLFSMRLGFAISRVVGQVILVLLFIFILTPMGLILRLAGKDPLQLKRPANADTFWQAAKDPSPLDRLF